MKKWMAAALAALLVLSLCACGKAEAPAEKNVDLEALYASLEPSLPEMFRPEGTMRLNYLGIEEEDCLQVITAICGDGLGADEIWLIQAKDADALGRITELANTRMAAKADETVDYNPEQYKVVEKGVILTKGNYLALLVSPDVENMNAAVEAALN